MKNKTSIINLMIKLAMISLFIMGALVFSYPFIADSINNYHDQKMIQEYVNQHNADQQQEKDARLAKLEAENQALIENKKTLNIPGMGLVEDPFEGSVIHNEKQDESYYQEHLLGAIYIPEIKVSLPLFDETNDILLERGGTLLQGTSYPIGGVSTHSVITSHSGHPEKRLFTDLEKLEIGDIFYIEIDDLILAYEIMEFNTVLPHEIDTLVIREGQDIVTLVTCTPYMINTHRLLVSGKRIDYVPQDAEKLIEAVQNHHTTRVYTNIGLLGAFISMSLILSYRSYRIYNRTKRFYTLEFDNSISDLSAYDAWYLESMWSRRIKQKPPIIEGNKVSFGKIRGGRYVLKSSDKKRILKAYVKHAKDSSFTIIYKDKHKKNWKVSYD